MRTTKQMCLGVGAVGAVAACMSFFFIMPNYRDARAVRRQVDDLQARVDTLATRREAVDRLEGDVRIARRDAATNLKTVPMSADVAGLIRKLSDQIDEVNIKEQTFTAGTSGPAIVGSGGVGGSGGVSGSGGDGGAGDESNVRMLPVAADMHATYESVVALINKAESMSRLVRVSSLRLVCKREEQKLDVPLLRASVGLEVIYDPFELP